MTEMKHRFESEVVRFVIANALKLLSIPRAIEAIEFYMRIKKQDLNLIILLKI